MPPRKPKPIMKQEIVDQSEVRQTRSQMKKKLPPSTSNKKNEKPEVKPRKPAISKKPIVKPETMDYDDDPDDNVQSNTRSTPWTVNEVMKLFHLIEQETDEHDQMPCGRRLNLLNWKKIGEAMKKSDKECEIQFNLLIKGIGRYRTLIEVTKKADTAQGVVKKPRKKTHIKEEIPDPGPETDEENFEVGPSSSTQFTPWPIQEMNKLMYTIGPEVDENDGMPLHHRINQINWTLIGKKMKKPAKECLEQYRSEKLRQEEARKKATSKGVTNRAGKQHKMKDDGAQSNSNFSEWTSKELDALFEAIQQEIDEDAEVLRGGEISQSSWELIGKTMKKPAKDCQQQLHFQLLKEGISNRFQDLLLEAKQRGSSQMVKNPMALIFKGKLRNGEGLTKRKKAEPMNAGEGTSSKSGTSKGNGIKNKKQKKEAIEFDVESLSSDEDTENQTMDKIIINERKYF